MAAQHTLSSLGVRSGYTRLILAGHPHLIKKPYSNTTVLTHKGSLQLQHPRHQRQVPTQDTNHIATPLPRGAAITLLCPDKVSLLQVSYTSPTLAERDPNLPIIPKRPQPHVQTPPNIPPIQTGACPPFASSTTISSPFYSRLRVLFTFPSQYLFAIGLSLLFSLRCSLPPTLCCTPKQHDSLGATPNSHATQI